MDHQKAAGWLEAQVDEEFQGGGGHGLEVGGGERVLGIRGHRLQLLLLLMKEGESLQRVYEACYGVVAHISGGMQAVLEREGFE